MLLVCAPQKKADYAQCLPESYDDGPPHKPGPPFLPFSKDGDDKEMGHDKPMDPEDGKGDKPMGPEKGMGHDKPMDPEKGMGDKHMGDKDGKFFGGKKPCVLGADQTCGSWWGPYPKCMCEEGYTCMKKVGGSGDAINDSISSARGFGCLVNRLHTILCASSGRWQSQPVLKASCYSIGIQIWKLAE